MAEHEGLAGIVESPLQPSSRRDPRLLVAVLAERSSVMAFGAALLPSVGLGRVAHEESRRVIPVAAAAGIGAMALQAFAPGVTPGATRRSCAGERAMGGLPPRIPV